MAHRLHNAGGLAGGIVYGSLNALAHGADHRLSLLGRLINVALQLGSCSVHVGIRLAGRVLCKPRATVRVITLGALYRLSVCCSHTARTWKHLRAAACHEYAAGTHYLHGRRLCIRLDAGTSEGMLTSSQAGSCRCLRASAGAGVLNSLPRA